MNPLWREDVTRVFPFFYKLEFFMVRLYSERKKPDFTLTHQEGAFMIILAFS